MGSVMNVLFFHSHDTGRYFSHYGFGDSSAEKVSQWALAHALTFRNAFCASPTCSPSRSALLTGQYPHSNGMLGLVHRGFSLYDYNQHLVPFLNRAGFSTVLCGVQHEGAGCFDSQEGGRIIGYSENITTYINEENINGESTAQWDLANARRAAVWLSQEGQEPFFLSVGLFSTHREYPSLKTINPNRLKPVALIHDSEENRVDHARFLESQLVYDQAFEIVIDALETSQYRDNTVVIVTTDHGLALPFSKCNLTEAGMGIALMMKVPGKELTDSATDALVSQVDLFPTLCELLGLEIPEWIQGQSFAHLFNDPKALHRKYLFGEINFHTSYEPARSVRTERYSYIHHGSGDDLHYRISNIDDSPAKHQLMSTGLKTWKKPPTALYDCCFDPLEKINLIDNPNYSQTVRELESILHQWQIETDDPLLYGEIPIPDGAIVNKPDCIEPDSDNPDDYL